MGGCLFAVAVSTSGCDLQDCSWQRQSLAPELPLVLEASWGVLSLPHAGPENIVAATWLCHAGLLLPLSLGKAAVLPAGLTAVLCLVNPCASLWSLPGSHRTHLIATVRWVANNTKQEVWGVADDCQMIF